MDAMLFPTECLKILLLEDSRTDAILIEKALSETALNIYCIQRADTLAAGLRILGEQEFDVVLMDLSLPDVTGFSGLVSIQNMAPKLPVVMLTAHEDEEAALSAVEHGAQDYLFKDKVNGPAIKRAMRFAIQRKQFEGTLIMRANFDPLTGLANRSLFESRLDMALARQKRNGKGLGILFIDLDGFKQVNDTLGHAAGDRLLQHVGQRLKQSVRPYDTAARFGGDEFALLVDDIGSAEHASVVARKVIRAITEPLDLNGQTIAAGASVGIATCLTGEDISREDLMRHADQAMYGAKLVPENCYQFYSEIGVVSLKQT